MHINRGQGLSELHGDKCEIGVTLEFLRWKLILKKQLLC